MIEQLKPSHQEHSKSDYGNYLTVVEAVDSVSDEFPAPDGRTREQTLELIESIQEIVRQSLWFERSSSLDDITQNQTATCVGYTIVGSEALERTKIKHNIAFVNGHSTIFATIDGQDKKEIRLVDMLSPELSQDVSEAFFLYRPVGQAEEKGRSFGTFNTRLLDNANPMRNPWLSIKDYTDERLEPASNRRLIVTLFTPEDGREVISNYAKFKRAAEGDDYETATTALLELDGVFPDVDIRGDSPDLVLGIVKKLSLEGRIAEAQEVTRSFYDSFVGDDTRLYEKRADCVQEIAKVTKRPEIARRAYELYNGALKRRRSMKAPVIGKMAVSKALMAELEELPSYT